MDFGKALAIVYNAIDVVNGQRTADSQIAKSPDLSLTGENGVLDSLGLVTIILAIERYIQETEGKEIDLTGHEAFGEDAVGSQTPSSIAQLIVDRFS